MAERPRWTLRRRLVLVLVTVLVAFSTVLGVSSALAIRANLTHGLDSDLRAASERSARFRDDGGRFTSPPSGTATSPTDGGLPTDVDPPPGQAAGTVGISTNAAGVTTVGGYIDDDGAWQVLTDEQAAELAAVPHDDQVHPVDLTDLGSYRAISQDRPDGGTSVTALPTESVDSAVQRFVVVEVVLAVLGVVVAAIVGAWLVRRSLRPLDAVADAATHVSSLPLDRGEVATIPRVGDDLADERTEVGRVGAALNRMLDHVESSLTARHDSETQVRQFVADASHELRTPLASIRGYAELVRRSPEDVPPDALRALDRIESEGSRMGGLVDDLLLLARLDAGRPLDVAPVDLAGLAVDAVMDAHAAGPDHVWELDLPEEDDADGHGGQPALTVLGDEARLRQVFTNLVGNARVHTPPGTRVTVGVRAEPGAVVVSVRDDGPGIPASLVPSLFQRFSRGDSARNRVGGSTGLGLAIVHAVVQAHHGAIEIRTRTEPGAGEPRGTTFEVRLPAA